MGCMILDGDIFGAATALVTTHGFRDAKAKAAERISEWSESDAPDADIGIDRWERVRAAITILQARLM